ncbi:LETM1-like protein [Actinidia rufa]|uniref:LETM1-like protein n=1 Tax=Actinidia rufa TaxID=165716 RepID=A0A7J0GDR5_9ERIC|nr:LETM1-like protein [Actinidia rufa]
MTIDPLESVIREKLSTKRPKAYEWFWSEQVPAVVTTYVNYFESNPRFTAATVVSGKGVLSGSGNANDIWLMLALSCIAAIAKLGPTKVSCSQFFSMIPDITGRLMEMLLRHRVKNDGGMEEVVFWVSLVQRQLQRAVDRERIWSKLTTCESIEVSTVPSLTLEAK